MRTPIPIPKPEPTAQQLDEQLMVAEKSLMLAETQYTAKLFQQLVLAEQGGGNQFATYDTDERNWTLTSQGGQFVDEKNIVELNRDPQIMRRQSYRFWRLHPHGRGILRNFVRFIVGREFGLDFDDEQHGTWNDDHTKLQLSSGKDEPLAVRELWDDFSERNNFIQKAKEVVLRTFRDGEMFLRRFVKNGKITLRFIEPEKIGWGMALGAESGEVKPEDIDDDDIFTPLTKDNIGDATKISGGIEYLADDPEIIVAYYVRYGSSTVKDIDDDDIFTPLTKDNIGDATKISGGIEYLADDPEIIVAYYVRYGSSTVTRVPAKDIIHTKPLADSNDLRGIPLLEVVAKRLTNYDQWEEYRMILNKMRTAVAFVRKVEGTAAQASALISNRASSRAQPQGREPHTMAGKREPMFAPGSILTSPAGVSWEALSPKLDARDASEDGRRFLLSIAAGVGLPEMLVTGDWSNSNYASSVESRTPAVREWEDWQDFFEPPFKRIYRWVVQAGIADLGLPKTTSQHVTISWPQLIAKDRLKESQRGQTLQAGGILSKTTWAKDEGLTYADELENMRLEAELEVAQATPGMADDAAAAAKYMLDRRASPGLKDAPGFVRGAARPPAQTTEAQAIIESLAELQDAVDSTIDDPQMHQAMTRYMGVANLVAKRVLGQAKKSKKRWRAPA
jgi:hypothetical protein